MIKAILDSKWWFFIPFVPFAIPNHKSIFDWYHAGKNYSETKSRIALFDFLIHLNVLYLIIIGMFLIEYLYQ